MFNRNDIVKLVLTLCVLCSFLNSAYAATVENNVPTGMSSISTATDKPMQSPDAYHLFQSATVLLQLGVFGASQGEAQNVAIQDLLGDRFTVTDHTDENVLLGLGIYGDSYTNDRIKILLGFNAYYLTQTFVQGNVIQEQMFTNLSYKYGVVNFPVYFAGRALLNLPNKKYNMVFDLGLGINIIQAGNVAESSLDNGVTIPDDMFAAQTTVSFSGAAGVGIRFNNLVRRVPLEVGYRFFYLGEGEFKPQTSAVPNPLTTGHSYANALIFTANI